MDKVFIEALEIECTIGIYDWERGIKQRVVLDIEMAFDNRKPAASDAITDTLDYDAIGQRLRAHAAVTTFGLIEALAESCAELLQREFGVHWLRLTLRKPGAVSFAANVGVQIERSHADN